MSSAGDDEDAGATSMEARYGSGEGDEISHVASSTEGEAGSAGHGTSARGTDDSSAEAKDGAAGGEKTSRYSSDTGAKLYVEERLSGEDTFYESAMGYRKGGTATSPS